VWRLQAAGTGVVRITSRLYHLASGQWIGSAIDLDLPDTRQVLGSAISYVRRYSVVGLLALMAEDDDDGSAASGQLIRRRAVVASTNGPAPEADVITDTGTPEASEPPPVAIPTDIGLPCGGQAISALKPAQLAMLVSEVAHLVHDDGDHWVPLLAALQAERAARLARGQRRPVMPASALGPDVPLPAISVASRPVLS
jgi:hypothetical protein